MNNLNRPAYPQPIALGSEGDILTPIGQHDDFAGFTKLEYASLMIAQGLLSGGNGANIEINGTMHSLSTAAIAVAKSILEDCNK